MDALDAVSTRRLLSSALAVVLRGGDLLQNHEVFLPAGHACTVGGFIFTLADSAFAFACNSYNQTTVAQQNQITYLSPGQPEERLTATAREVSRSGRSGIYDVTVTGEDDRVVALFRGLSRSIKGQLFTEEEPT